MTRTLSLLFAAILVTLAASGYAQTPSTSSGQAYPNRSVRVIVPYPAGGGADFVGRVYAKALSDSLAQQFVVDNRGGANGNVGS